MKYDLLPMGDAALTISFPELVGAAGARRSAAIARALRQSQTIGELDGVKDLAPAPKSVTLWLDPFITDMNALARQIDRVIATLLYSDAMTSRHWRLPACYSLEHGWDLKELAETKQLDIEEVVALHSAQNYDVLSIGFLPGFPFMSGTPAALHLPRRSTPRTRLPAGTVAIANDQTAIYPWESPGGWHLLAKCPVPLFVAEQQCPSLLRPGDVVRFTPVTTVELAEIEADLATGRTHVEDYLQTADETA